MGFSFAIPVLVVCGLLAHTLKSWQRGRGRWGTVRGAPIPVEAGAYRSGAVHETRAAEAPGVVRLAGVVARVWAALTLLVFAPAGALGLVVLADGSHHGDGVLVALAWLAMVFSGFVLGVALVVAAGRLDRHEAGPLGHTQLWSHVHHVFVALTTLFAASRVGQDAVQSALVLVVPICAAGVGVTFLLGRAARRAMAIDA